MTTIQNISPLVACPRNHITCLAFTAIIIGASCTDTIAQSPPSKQPQLYLTNDTVPKKGYIEQGSKSVDGKIAFRVCDTSEQITVQQSNLKATAGTCTVDCVWCVAKIVGFNPDGSVQIEALDRQTVAVTAKDWKKGFASETYEAAITAKVGDFVGGVAQNRPGSLYVIATPQ
jgi:hypothetical protein